MSKLFFDHLVVLDEIDIEIKNIAKTQEEKEDLWKLIDEILVHKILHAIFSKLPNEHHEEFLTRFHRAPYDEELLNFLDERLEEDIEEIIRKEIENFKLLVLEEIRRH